MSAFVLSAVTLSRVRSGTRWTAERSRMPLFYAVTGVFLAFLLVALNEPLRFTVLAWLPEYGFVTHRVHHVMIGALLTLLVVSVAVQLYRPARRVGAYLLAALLVGSIVVATAVAEGIGAVSELAIFVVPLVLIGLLHPGLRSFRPTRETVDPRLLVLGAVAAVPMVVFAAIQLNLHLTMADDHVAFEHYIMMAGGALTIGLGALLAGFRPVGWRVLVYGIAVLAVFVGAASIAFPGAEQGANFGVIGGTLAVLWAVCFVAVAEYGARETGHPDADEPATDISG